MRGTSQRAPLSRPRRPGRSRSGPVTAPAPMPQASPRNPRIAPQAGNRVGTQPAGAQTTGTKHHARARTRVPSAGGDSQENRDRPRGDDGSAGVGQRPKERRRGAEIVEGGRVAAPDRAGRGFAWPRSFADPRSIPADSWRNLRGRTNSRPSRPGTSRISAGLPPGSRESGTLGGEPCTPRTAGNSAPLRKTPGVQRLSPRSDVWRRALALRVPQP